MLVVVVYPVCVRVQTGSTPSSSYQGQDRLSSVLIKRKVSVGTTRCPPTINCRSPTSSNAEGRGVYVLAQSRVTFRLYGIPEIPNRASINALVLLLA